MSYDEAVNDYPTRTEVRDALAAMDEASRTVGRGGAMEAALLTFLESRRVAPTVDDIEAVILAAEPDPVGNGARRTIAQAIADHIARKGQS